MSHPSSFSDSYYALEILDCLREDGVRAAKLKLSDLLLLNTRGPLLDELNYRLNSLPSPHLVIDSIWLSQKYGGISRVWHSLLSFFNNSSLFSVSTKITLINRDSDFISSRNLDTVKATAISPFDYSSYPFVCQENHDILSSIEFPVFCSTWISRSSQSALFPEVILLHDLIPESYGCSDSLYLNCRNQWLSNASSVLSVSQATSLKLKHLYPALNNVDWCHPPLPAHVYNLSERIYYDNLWSELKARLGSAKGYFYLPSSAGLATYKNPDVLLRALCDPRLSDYHLIISGVSNLVLRDQINHHFPQLSTRVHFAGFSDAELISIYQNVICVIVPSLVEGFGLPVVEAAALGCVSVIADSPGLMEAGSKCSLRFPPSDYQYLSDLLALLADPVSYRWLLSCFLPRFQSRISTLSPDLFGLCLLAQARRAFSAFSNF